MLDHIGADLLPSTGCGTGGGALVLGEVSVGTAPVGEVPISELSAKAFAQRIADGPRFCELRARVIEVDIGPDELPTLVVLCGSRYESPLYDDLIDAIQIGIAPMRASTKAQEAR